MIVAVGMSGGVDSTVAAAILRDQGHEVIGLTMQVWDGSIDLPEGGRASCYGPDEPEEIEKIHALAQRVGIPCHTIPLAGAYKREVLDYFRREYLAGRTPNPCARCNHAMKFGALLSAARASGIAFDAFATGHYARVGRNPQTGRHELRRARDAAKDQSYFLARLTQEQLAGAVFPLGDWDKTRVRETAVSMGFPDVADQQESQDFIGCRDYSVLFTPSSLTPGPILDRRGTERGRHEGIARYTIGQRKGLGLGGGGEPLYVVGLDAARNAVIVGGHDELFSGGLVAEDVNWIAVERLDKPTEAEVCIRNRARPVPALLLPDPEGDPNRVCVHFRAPQKSVTPGQVAVFYDGDLVLGAGWIERAVEGVEPSGGRTVQA